MFPELSPLSASSNLMKKKFEFPDSARPVTIFDQQCVNSMEPEHIYGGPDYSIRMRGDGQLRTENNSMADFVARIEHKMKAKKRPLA